MKRYLALLLALSVAGCSSLIPKKVEFFQDKVQVFPEQSAQLRELERQAIYKTVDLTTEVVVAAAEEQASTNVIVPAKEAVELSQAVAVVAGPPEKPATVAPSVLADKLETAMAKYNTKVEKFKAANNENQGKKIEGTGLIQVSYFWWAGGIVAGLLVLFVIGKFLLSAYATVNPGAAIGLNVVNAAQSVVTKGFSQLVKGGEDFKTWVEKEITDSGVKQKILDAFRTSHVQAQDQEVQNVVQAITK